MFIFTILLQKTRFHVSQTLSYKNGYSLPLRPQFDVGGSLLPNNQLNEADLDELANTRPSLTYGNQTKPAPVEFVPGHVAFDKKVRLLTILHFLNYILTVLCTILIGAAI